MTAGVVSAQHKTTIEEVVRVTQTDEVMSETSLVSAPALAASAQEAGAFA